jgi:glycosyltransferase involved in cell wall biosynthesis
MTSIAPELSVIVPTYNRSGALGRCLEALEGQTVRESLFDVLVVDDGSTDDTAEVVESTRPRLSYDLKYYYQKNRGPAAARNLGLREATGRYVLFIGDDIIASPQLIAQHLAWHEDHPKAEVAILGYISWAPELKVNPLMYWLEHGGPQFSYDHMVHGEAVDWQHFYTSNVSVVREFLLDNGCFDEDFHHAAWEDLELAYRLSRTSGLTVLFNSMAVAYHLHSTDLASFRSRCRVAGRSRRILGQKHPELATPPKAISFWRNWERILLTLAFPLSRAIGWRRAMNAFFGFQAWVAEREGYFSE